MIKLKSIRMDSMGMSSCPISSCETYLADYLLEATIKLLLFRYVCIVVGKWRIKRENFFGPFSAIFFLASFFSTWPPFFYLAAYFYLASFFLPGHLEYHGA